VWKLVSFGVVELGSFGTVTVVGLVVGEVGVYFVSVLAAPSVAVVVMCCEVLGVVVLVAADVIVLVIGEVIVLFGAEVAE